MSANLCLAQFLQSPILPDEWDKFIDRAKVVRQISHPYDYCDRIDDSVFVELRKIAVLINLPLFPSLEVLYWRGAQGCDAFFASPSLEHVTIKICLDDVDYGKSAGDSKHSHVVWPFLSSLPSLKELWLDGSSPLNWLRPINQLKHLRILDLSLATALIDRAFLREVSLLENLAELSVKMSDSVDGEDFMECENNNGFTSLRKLRVLGSPRILVEMFKMFATPSSLQDLSIFSFSFNESENRYWNACFVILGTRFRSSLRKLRLQEPRHSRAPSHLAIPIVEFLHPLLKITLLEELEFIFDDDVPLYTMSNDDLAIMSESWTNLIVLQIIHCNPFMLSPLPTFQALLILANNCPHLFVVSIKLDTKTPPPQLTVPVTHPLKRLCFHGDSYITSASRPSISLFLGTLFPDLFILTWRYCSDINMERLWEEVRSSLPAVQATSTEY
jgi:hypothetical protein